MELTGLPVIDPLAAQTRTDVLGALNGCEAGGLLLRAAIPADAGAALGAWFQCQNQSAFAIDVEDGECLRLGASETARAIQALEAAELLLRALERALGIELVPEALEEDWFPDAHDVVEVEGLARGRVVRQLRLALPRGLRLSPVAAPFAPGLLEHAPLPVTIALPGPRLAPHEAADLGPGDLVLLGPGPLRATLRIPARQAVTGTFDPQARRFVPAISDRPPEPENSVDE